jgi:hypothetical protein
MIVVLRVQEPAATLIQETETAELDIPDEDAAELEEPVELDDFDDADVEAALCVESSTGYIPFSLAVPSQATRAIAADKATKYSDFILLLLL